MLAVGMVLEGYCGGYFDRESHGDKRVEAIGADWVVARRMDADADPEFASGPDIHKRLAEYVRDRAHAPRRL